MAQRCRGDRDRDQAVRGVRDTEQFGRVKPARTT
jgi:hypothetical protein